MPGSRPSSTPLQKKQRKGTWIALDEPVQFTCNDREWVVQDYNPKVDMFLCESRAPTGTLAVWIARFDQVVEYTGMIPGLRSRVE